MTIFDLDVLNNNRGRYVVVAEAFLPLLLGLICCTGIYNEPSEEMHRGRKACLSLMYLIVALLWGFSLFISSMTFDTIALIMFASFSAVLLCLCIYICMYHDQKYWSILTAATEFVIVLSIITAVTSPTTDLYAAMLVALTFAPVGLSAAVGINHGKWLPHHDHHDKHPAAT